MIHYDNLNRMTSAAIANGGAIYSSYTNDILGNRTHRNWGANSSSAMTYEWDVLNRAKVIAGVSAGGTYHYRADGQRVEKVTGTTITWVPDAPLSRSGHYDTNYVTNGPSSRYFYDGQMGFEDDYNPSGSVTKVNRYALGARGIDRIENYESSTTTYGYPLYDGHGNMRAVLSKSGSSYSTGNWRTYDVWGSVRSGSSTGDPKQRYVASIGHVADDETSLIYMRARYYEPTTGRFLSEDTTKDGNNWFVYCNSNPPNLADPTGNSAWFISAWEAIKPLLQAYGFMGAVKAAMRYGALQFGLALEALSMGLMNLGLSMSVYGQALAESPNWWSRIGGAVMGRLGAKALSAGITIGSLGHYIVALGLAFEEVRYLPIDPYNFFN